MWVGGRRHAVTYRLRRGSLANLVAVLEAAGSSPSKVVKTTIFLTDLGDFQEVNTAYGAFFADSPPARSTVQVAALPLGSNIEIEFILAI